MAENMEAQNKDRQTTEEQSAARKPDGVLKTTVMYLYTTAFKGSNNYSYAATMSVGLFLLIVIFSILAFRALGARKEEGGVD